MKTIQFEFHWNVLPIKNKLALVQIMEYLNQ